MQLNRIKSITGSIRKKNTLKNYEFLFTRFSDEFSDRELESITPDEIIFRTTNPRNRIMLELMAKSGMRISESSTMISEAPHYGSNKTGISESNPLCPDFHVPT